MGDKSGKKNPFTKMWKKIQGRFESVTGSSTTSSSVSSDQIRGTLLQAARNMNLDKKTQKHLASSLQDELQRREKLRRELLAGTTAQLPWGNQQLSQQRKNALLAAQGASSFPISLDQMSTSEKGSIKESKEPEKSVPSIPYDQNAWKPVEIAASARSEQSQLDKQRQEWMNKSLSAMKKPAPSSPESSSNGAQVSSQPLVVHMDQKALDEIRAHTLMHMIHKCITDNLDKEKAKKSPKSYKEKHKNELTAEELIEMRNASDSDWVKTVRENTVVSFGISKPTDEDFEKAKKVKAKSKSRRTEVHFDKTVEVITANIGQDFKQDEWLEKHKTSLKRA